MNDRDFEQIYNELKKEEIFEQIYLSSVFIHILESDESIKNPIINNWQTEMKQLRQLLNINIIELQNILFTEENVKAIEEPIITPIENVFIDNIGTETLYHKISRKKGGRGEIDRRKYLDAIPNVLSHPTFIIEHKPTSSDTYNSIRHFYFRKTKLQDETAILMFVVDLENKERPKLLSFQKIDDIYDKIKEGDVIIYKDGQKTEIQLQKTTSTL